MSESARINRRLESIRCEEIKQAIQKRQTLCCPPVIVESASIIPREGTIENAKGDVALWGTVFPGATVINGTSVTTESIRIKALLQSVDDNNTDYIDPDARFSMYRRPYVPPVCPPIPTILLNGNLPKASTKIDCGIQRFQGKVIRNCRAN